MGKNPGSLFSQEDFLATRLHCQGFKLWQILGTIPWHYHTKTVSVWFSLRWNLSILIDCFKSRTIFKKSASSYSRGENYTENIFKGSCPRCSHTTAVNHFLFYHLQVYCLQFTGVFWVLLPSTFLSSIFLDAALDISIVRKLGAPRFEPGAAGWEVRTQPLCYAAPFTVKLTEFVSQGLTNTC